MKSNQFRLLAAVAAATLCGSVFAADNATLTVNASVIGVCLFQSPTATMTIANSGSVLDPSLASNGTGSTNISYRCTKGQNPTLSVGGSTTSPYQANSGAARLSSGGATPEFIPFQISWSAPSQGTGMGNTLSVTLNGLIQNADFANAGVGSYSASVALQITP